MTDTTTLPKVRQRRRQIDAGEAQIAGPAQGHLMVTRTRYGSEPEEVTNQSIAVPQFPVQPAYVSVRAKETINMGDYNSVGVEVSLMLPCLPEVSELERVHVLASDVVERWMNNEISRATNPDWQRPETT